MNFEQVVMLPIIKEDVLLAIKNAQSIQYIDNLRNRESNVMFDSKIRGFLGELGIQKWLAMQGIQVKSNVKSEGKYDIDIDLQYKGKDLEIKTSLIPDVDKNLRTVFQKRDIKLIVRKDNSITDLKSDVHLQVYFDHKTKMKDDWLKKQSVDLYTDDTEQIYNQLLGRAYLKRTFFFCWIDKLSLIDRIHKLPVGEKKWGYGMREFWNCPLSKCYPPTDLIQHLTETV